MMIDAKNFPIYSIGLYHALLFLVGPNVFDKRKRRKGREMKKSLNPILIVSRLTLWLNLLATGDGRMILGVFLSPHSRYLAANGAIMRTSILGILNFNGELLRAAGTYWDVRSKTIV